MLNREQVQRRYDDINLTAKHNMRTSLVHFKIRGRRRRACLGLLSNYTSAVFKSDGTMQHHLVFINTIYSYHYLYLRMVLNLV